MIVLSGFQIAFVIGFSFLCGVLMTYIATRGDK